MTVAEGGGIFISYRRHETSHLAGRLYDRLADRFGEGQVFIDVDTIEPGVDFTEEIFRAVAACKVLVAIIGPGWLASADERDGRRLDDPDDIVRLEIEAALARGVRVIPVLAEEAVMPGRKDLPESLAGLARRNALRVRHESFRSDAARLVTTIERAMAATTGTAAVPSDLDAHGARSARNAFSETAHKHPEPARNDLARAVQLLNEAERIASSTSNGGTKVSQLSKIAQVLAAIDPERAARLLTEAERVARSISAEFFGASALGRVAAGVAAIDPDRAEGIVNSITDRSAKEGALSEVAEAVAATDPDRAERIANSITNSITSEYSKGPALVEVVRAVAATDPDRAERIANSIAERSAKVLALSEVAQVLTATDPDRATRLLTKRLR
jgi:hypothetical protein